MMLPAAADHTVNEDNGPLVEAVTVKGNPSCGDLGDWDYEFKVDQALGLGTHEFSDPDSAFEVTIVVTNSPDGHVMSFDANIAVLGVFVKGGPQGNLYDYSAMDGAASDANLHAPKQRNSSTYAGISHVSFCFDDVPDIPPLGVIDVNKTAEGDFDRDITWSLDKSVDPDSHSGAAGEDAGSSDWTVVATKTETLGNYQVSGEIEISTVGSELDADVTSIEDSLGDLADLDCSMGGENIDLPGTIPADSVVVCTYSVDQENDDAESNTVTVAGDFVDGDPFEVDDTASIAWTETATGDEEVTLGDERFEHSEVISETTTEVFPETFPCPADASEYTNGVHERTETNVATLTGDGTDLQADASVDIVCQLDALDVEKTAVASYDRTVDWELTKTVDPDSHSGTAGDTFESDWTVTATKTETEDNFQVTGDITVTNDTAIDRDFTVTDVLDDGTVATVDCPTLTVPANDAVTCTYEAFPDDDSATLNTATISMDGNEDQVATAAVDFEENLIGDDEVLLEDDRSGTSELISTTTVLEYTEPFECPTDTTLYEDGQYSETFLNTATLTGPTTTETASASVTMDCALLFVGETVTGAGEDWPGTSNWFQYSQHPGDGGSVDLIQGRNHNVVGSVTFSDDGSGMTTLHFTFDEPWELEDVGSNVKIQPMEEEPTEYIPPGAFEYHFTRSGSSFSVTVPTEDYYGIHLDAGFWDVG